MISFHECLVTSIVDRFISLSEKNNISLLGICMHTHTHTVIFVIMEIDWNYGLGYMFVGQASHFNSLQSVLRLPFGPNEEAQGVLHLDDLGRRDVYLALQPSHWLTPHFLPAVQSQWDISVKLMYKNCPSLLFLFLIIFGFTSHFWPWKPSFYVFNPLSFFWIFPPPAPLGSLPPTESLDLHYALLPTPAEFLPLSTVWIDKFFPQHTFAEGLEGTCVNNKNQRPRGSFILQTDIDWGLCLWQAL